MSAASFGPWGGPAVVFAYGDKGVGKSVDQFLADPLAWTLGPDGCLKGARWFCGDAVYSGAEHLLVRVSTLDDVIAVLTQMAEGKRERRNVRIDDFTPISATTIHQLRSKYGDTGRGPYQMWDHYDRLVDTIKVYANTLGIHVFASSHIAQPHQTTNRGFVKGGPDVGGPGAMDTILSTTHVIYKAEPDPARWPWPAGYRCDNPSATWEFKDRHNVVMGSAPMNLREILRVAGYTLPRYPGMEWQDEWADRVANEVDAGRPARDAFTDAVDTLTASGVERGVAYWTARDGLCRSELRVRQDPLSRALSASATVGAPGGVLPVAPVPPVVKK